MSGRDKDATRAANGAHDDALPYLYGEDGCPTGGPSDTEIAHAAETRFKRDRQAALDRCQSGDLTGFTEAMRLCWRRDPDGVPYRLVEASEALVERAMADDDKRDRREWHVHLVRWEEMVELLERGPELARLGKANLEGARRQIAVKPTDEKVAKKRARLLERMPEFVAAANDDFWTSVVRASVAVAKVLKETDARGRARKVKGGTVRASYELVEAAGGKHATFESYRREVQRRELLRRRAGKQD
jgi:hypothetical protein